MLGLDAALINEYRDGHKSFIKQADEAMQKQFKKSLLQRWSEDTPSQWLGIKLLKNISTKTNELIGVVLVHETVTYITEAYPSFFSHISDEKSFLSIYALAKKASQNSWGAKTWKAIRL